MTACIQSIEILSVAHGNRVLSVPTPLAQKLLLSHTYITLHVPSRCHCRATQGATCSCGCSLRSTPGQNPLPGSGASRPSWGEDPLLGMAPQVHSAEIQVQKCRMQKHLGIIEYQIVEWMIKDIKDKNLFWERLNFFIIFTVIHLDKMYDVKYFTHTLNNIFKSCIYVSYRTSNLLSGSSKSRWLSSDPQNKVFSEY